MSESQMNSTTKPSTTESDSSPASSSSEWRSELKSELLELLEERKRRNDRDKLSSYKPYQRQLEFHQAGAYFRERLLMAANQVGKTLSAAAELATHLTGRYPSWWEGKRFDHPIRAWAGSKTSEVTRDTVQRMLLGDPKDKAQWGQGMIPGDFLVRTTQKQGVPDAVEGILVRHVSGANSTCGLKSYDQGREKWQGETLHALWNDEEPPQDIYMEGLTRTNATGGIVFTTFTPLLGMSEVVRMFLVGEKSPSRNVTMMTIYDAAHFTEKQRAEIIASYPVHERDVRTKGIPALGSGRIYPVAEEAIAVDPFEIPQWWAAIGGLDLGWDHPTAAVKLVHDRDTDIVYITNCYRVREQTPMIHAEALKRWGKGLPWAWPHDAYQRDKKGERFRDIYEEHGLNMLGYHATFEDGSNSVEAGVMDILERMQSQRFKVFRGCGDWFEEFRLYHREEGLIVKEYDDIMDATRYAVMQLRDARAIRPKQAVDAYRRAAKEHRGWSWMGN